MKKLKILIPSLIATTSMPLVSLTGCKTGDTNTKQWIVQFNTNGGSFIESVCVDDGQIIKEPAVPTRTGFTFNGWFKDEELQETYSFNEPVTADTTVYVAWKSNQATSHLYFTTDGAGTLSDNSIEVPTGTKWIDIALGGMLPTPTPAEEFDGWYRNEKKLELTDRTEINEDWYITARFNQSAVEHSSYIIDCPSDISLTETIVIPDKKFETNIVTTGEAIDIAWVKAVINCGIRIENPNIQKIDNKTLKLTVDKPKGDIAIVIDKQTDIPDYYSHLCNDDSDGFELINNSVDIESGLIGIVQSSKPIDQEGAIAKIVINGNELEPDDYTYKAVIGKPNQTSISIVNKALIVDDVFIWMDPLTINWDSKTGPYPYEITPLPAETDPEEAKSKFYELLTKNRKNYLNDFLLYMSQDKPFPPIQWMSAQANDIDISLEEDNVIQINKLNFSLWRWSIYQKTPETTQSVLNYDELHITNVKLKLALDSAAYSNMYVTNSYIEDMLPLEIWEFLKAEEWSVEWKIVDPDIGVEEGSYDTNYVKGLTQEQWEEQWYNVKDAYDYACLLHPIHYLQNITPPESK